jgi:hypothetical protein
MYKDAVGIIAHLKVILFYGAESMYPFFTLFTAVGVAKIAFGIPTWTAVVLMGGLVFGFGFFAFRIGIFGKDLDIKWQNTESARRLCEHVERIESILSEKKHND